MVSQPVTLARSSAEVVDRRLAAAAALAVAIGAGLLTSFVAPRGPTTAGNALLVMLLGLVIGLVGGALARSRWILVPLALVYIVGVELGRIDVVGPTTVAFEQADEVQRLLNETIVPTTYGR